MKSTGVSICTHSFLDAYNGQINKVFGGGLERYIYDLCQVIRHMDLQPVVHQLTGGRNFTVDAEGITVHGHHCTNDTYVQVFEQMAAGAEGLVIYSSQIWQPIQYRKGNIGICHGISWDHPHFSLDYKRQVAASVQNALQQLDHVVSVDAHFLSYCRSVCTYADMGKVSLLPNSVDSERFRPTDVPTMSDSQSTIRVLYPRRISQERGILLMMAAADELVAKYPQVIIEFAGEVIAGDVLSETFLMWLKRHPHQQQIVHKVYPIDEMPEAYQSADIAVIPTVFSEGTSYSCLEALSCGLAVVSTNIGGLNDLIMNHFNGRLIAPDYKVLVAVTSELIEDLDQRIYLGKNARNVALSFNKTRWNQSWQDILESHIGK